MKITKPKGKSPYATKQKKEFLYSDQYADWAAAVEKHGLDSEEAGDADRKFRQRFGVPTVRIDTEGRATYAHY